MKKKFISSILFIFFTPFFVFANNYDEGLKSYNEGNFVKALEIWKPLASLGDPKSQYMYGLMNAEGKGLAQNFQKAVNWYILSAEQGYPNAQNNLGLMYALGKGIEKNLVLAYMWFGLVNNDNLDVAKIAKKNLNFITNEMSAKEVQKGLLFIDICKKINLKKCDKIKN